MASSSVREGFDRIAGEYDGIKLRVIPGYREVQELVDRHAVLPDRAPARVLELGSGTGEWAERFLTRCPDAVWEGVEFSEQMRGIAGRRLEPFRDRVQLHDSDLDGALPAGRFDLVVSFFAIHHVRDKERLMVDIAERLAQGGRFLWADITTAPTPLLEELFIDDWVGFMRQAGLEEEHIEHVLEDHRLNDLPERVETMLGYMQRAGFDPAALTWLRGKFAVLLGRRSL